MTWQAITEEESVPVVKAGDAMVSIYFMFEIVCTLALEKIFILYVLICKSLKN